MGCIANRVNVEEDEEDIFVKITDGQRYEDYNFSNDINKETTEICFCGIEFYSEIINNNPDSLDAFLKRGIYYFVLSDFYSAQADFLNVIRLDPKNAKAYLFNGIINFLIIEDEISKRRSDNMTDNDYMKIRNNVYYEFFNKSISDINKSLELDNTYSNSYIYSAIIQYNFNNTSKKSKKDIISKLTNALKFNKDINTAFLYWLRGILYHKIGEEEFAIRDLKRAIDLDSTYYNKCKDIKVTLVLHSGPSYENITVDLPLLDILYGNYKKRKYHGFNIDHFKKVFFYAVGKSEDILFYKTISSYKGKLVSSIPFHFLELRQFLLENKIEINFGMDDLFVLAEEYTKSEDYEYAVCIYSEYLKANPNEVNAYFLRGNIYYKMKNYEYAIIDFDNALECSPDENKIDIYLMRGKCFIQLNYIEKAIKNFYKVIEYDINNAEAYYYIGYALNTYSDSERIIDLYSKAIELNPNEGKYYYARARCLYVVASYDYEYGKSVTSVLQKFNQCISDCEKAILLNPDYNIELNSLMNECNNIIEYIFYNN
ncbi:MAG: tetratricopeptide repeat protein [Ignavibacteria bacterium]|nr:tetratricopeptide repeat protein [Ignavibacteria bacterium]